MKPIPSFIKAGPARHDRDRKPGHYSHESYPQIGEYLKEQFPDFCWKLGGFQTELHHMLDLLGVKLIKCLMPPTKGHLYGYLTKYDLNTIASDSVREREFAIIHEMVDTLRDIQPLRDPDKTLFVNYSGFTLKVELDPESFDYIPKGFVHMVVYEADPKEIFEYTLKKLKQLYPEIDV